MMMMIVIDHEEDKPKYSHKDKDVLTEDEAEKEQKK